MILVTGGSGFVGAALIKRLSYDGFKIRACVRDHNHKFSGDVESIHIQSINGSTSWDSAFKGVEVVVHCAARVHVMDDLVPDQLNAYRQVNVEGSLNLALKAALAGVRRFLYISSIKVNGESTHLNHPFTADDVPEPLDPYGVSKLEAEQGLRELEMNTGMEVVIVRPPLVYGPGVKANFASMMSWVARGIPLPFGAIYNVRSFVALDNLVDMLVTCLKHPAAAGQTFLVSDNEDVSTTELLRRTAKAMDKKAILLPIPAVALVYGAAILQRHYVAQRICGSLQVDIKKTCRLLDWTPPLTLDQGLKKAVEGMKW